MRKITDPYSISKLTLSLLQNNVITKKMMLALKIIEGALIIFYALVIQQQMLKVLKIDNQKNLISEPPIDIRLSFDFFLKYHDFMVHNQAMIQVIAISLAIVLFVILIIFIILIVTHDKVTLIDLKQQKIYKKCLGVIFVLVGQILYIPFTDIIVRAFMHDYNTSLGAYLGMQISNSICLLLLFLMVFYQKRLFKLNMPADDLWGSPNSNGIYFGILAHLIIPVILAIDQAGKYIYIEIIAILIIQLIYTIMIIMLPHTFDQLKSKIQKVSQVINVLILEISVIFYIFKDLEQKEGIYLLFLMCFQGYAILKIDESVKNHYLLKYKQGKIKMELEYEYILLYLLEISQNFLNETSRVSKNNHQQILKLLEHHQMECYDITCFCNYSDQFIEIFKESERQASNIFVLDFAHFKKLKYLIKDSNVGQIKSSIQRMRLDQTQIQQDSKNDQSINLNEIKIEENEHTLDLAATVLQQKKKKGGYKVELQQMRQKFVSHLFLIFFKQINQKFPLSLRIHQLFNYYTAFIVQKPQLCLTSLRGSTDKNLSWLNKVSKYVNEYYILSKLSMIQQSKGSNLSTVDGEHYIKINQLQDLYTSQIEQLATTTISYWQSYLSEELSPISIYKTGVKLAKEVQQLYGTFKDLEKSLVIKDFKIYYLFAKVQEKIINDQEGYTIFYTKMKSIMALNKLYLQNTKKQFAQEDSGFVVVDGHQQTYGKVLFLNKIMAKLLQRETEDVRYFNINQTMPKLIEEKHDKFMKSYNETGDSVILNKKLLSFVKDKKNALIPVEVYIKFHYSVIYKYCFISLIQPITQLIPYKDSLRYDVKQLVFMTIDTTEGLIYEVSDNFISLLKCAGILSYKDVREISFTEKKHTIGDMFQGFNFYEVMSQIKKGSKKEQVILTLNSQLNQQVFEGILMVDFNSFNDNLEWGQSNINNDYTLEMKVAIYYESYGNGSLEVGFVVMTHQASIRFQHIDNFAKQQYEIDEEESRRKQEEEEDEGGSSSGGSQSTSSASHQSVEQFHSFYQQHTPKILKIVIQLVIVMFLVSFSIASINLGLNIKNQQRNTFEIYTTRSSFERINIQTSIRCILRILLNIANGYEPNSSDQISDRWTTYQDLLDEKISDLIENQNFLDNSGYPFSPDFTIVKNAQQIKLELITSRNELLYQNATMNVAQSLLRSRLTSAADASFQGYKGQLSIHTLKPNTTGKYSPSEIEQTFYFLMVNMYGVYRQYNRLFTDLYIKDTHDHADDNLQQAMITTIISIITIFVVALIVSPIISLTEERKFKALIFFLKIPKDSIISYIKHCSECIDLINEDTKEKHQALKDNNNNNMDSHSVNGHDQHLSYQEGIGPYNNDGAIEDVSMFESQIIGGIDAFGFGSSTKLNLIPIRNYSSNRKLSKMTQRENRQPSEIEEDIFHEDEEEKNQRSFTDLRLKPQSEENASQSQVDVNESQEQNNVDTKNKVRLSRIVELGDQDKAEKEKQKEKDRHEEEQMQVNLKAINQLAFKHKMRAFLAVILVIAIFSVYFIISFLMSKTNYENASNASDDLNIIFLKEACFETTVGFIRENQIRNTTLLLTGDGKTNAATYYLNKCMENEQSYTQLKKRMPSYLEQANWFINDLESKNFCDTVFYGEHEKFKSQCTKAIDGLLNNGITYFLSYMFAHAQKLNMEFETANKLKQRDMNFLLKALNETQTLRLLDTKLTLLVHVFEELKNNVQDSVLSYFSKLLTELIIVYAVFIVILIITMIYFTVYAFQKIKIVMWNTNLLLKIIPHDVLNKKEQQKLRNFFVN